MDNKNYSIPARQYKRKNGQTIYSSIDRKGERLTEDNCDGHIIGTYDDAGKLSAKYVGR